PEEIWTLRINAKKNGLEKVVTAVDAKLTVLELRQLPRMHREFLRFIDSIFNSPARLEDFRQPRCWTRRIGGAAVIFHRDMTEQFMVRAALGSTQLRTG